MLVFVGFSSTDFLKFFVGDDRYFAVGCLGFLFFCVFIWRILKFIFNILYIKVLKDILNELGVKNRKILNSFKFCCLFFSELIALFIVLYYYRKKLINNKNSIGQ